MEELKLLIEAVAELPELAIWVVAMYFFFKLAIVGSIFGVVRFFILKLHDVLQRRYDALIKEKEPNVVVKQHNIMIHDRFISSIRNDDNGEFERLINRMIRPRLSYIFPDDISRVHKALDELEKRENGVVDD